MMITTSTSSNPMRCIRQRPFDSIRFSIALFPRHELQYFAVCKHMLCLHCSTYRTYWIYCVLDVTSPRATNVQANHEMSLSIIEAHNDPSRVSLRLSCM